MMTKDEALKMAIDWFERPQYDEYMNDVLDACKEALEQPAQEPVSKTAERDYNFMRDLAIGTEDILNEILSAKPIGYVDEEQFRRWEALKGTQYESVERTMLPFSTTPYKDDLTDCSLPLYTHSHQWQGLTDDEKIKAFKANHCDDLEDAFMCGIQFAEVMLKEKNYVL